MTSIICCPGPTKIWVSIEFVKVKYSASWSTYTRMKKMGFFGVALAATCMGDVTLDLSSGSATLSGKLFDPFGYGGVQVDCGGSHAGGAGKGLVCGVHVIGTGGVAG